MEEILGEFRQVPEVLCCIRPRPPRIDCVSVGVLDEHIWNGKGFF